MLTPLSTSSSAILGETAATWSKPGLVK